MNGDMPEGEDNDVEMIDDNHGLIAGGVLGKTSFFHVIDQVLDKFCDIKIDALVAEGAIDEPLSLELDDITKDLASDIMPSYYDVHPPLFYLLFSCQIRLLSQFLTFATSFLIRSRGNDSRD